MHRLPHAQGRLSARVPLLLVLPLLVLAVLAGCTRDAGEQATAEPEAIDGGPLKLALTAEPVNGEAPLAVRFEAELIGEVEDPDAFGCPTLAWTLDARDEGEVVIAQPEGCAPGVVPRRFTLDHTYAAARSYETSVRFIARDVPASNLVQILVRGPTVTPAPRVAFPGPTIVIATPAGTRVAMAEGSPAPAEATGQPPGGGATGAAPEVGTQALGTEVGTSPPPATTAEAGTRVAVLPPGTSAATEAAPLATGIVARPTGMLIPVTPGATRAPPRAPTATLPAVVGVPSPTSIPPLGTSVAVGTPIQPPALESPIQPAPGQPTSRPRATAPTALAARTLVPGGPTAVLVPPTGQAQVIPTRVPGGVFPAPTQPQVIPTRMPGGVFPAPTQPQVIPTRMPGGVFPAPTQPQVIPTRVPGAVSPPTAVFVVPTPSRPGGTARRVLPADLYYIAGPDRRLWHLPASGERPSPETAADLPLDDFALAPSGIIAFTSGGGLYLTTPGIGSPMQIAEQARAPVWSRNGRQLAYGTPDGVYVYDIVSRVATRLTDRGEPMAWSRDATWLLVGVPGERIALVSSETGTRTELPFDGVTSAGWLPDRDVIWMAGDGLRLLTLGQAWAQTTLLPPEVPSSNVFIRPDDTLLTIADTGAGPAVHQVDLASDDLLVRRAGPPLTLGAPDNAAWAPDGRHMARAGAEGVALLDPFTGAEVPLIALPAARPAWLLLR